MKKILFLIVLFVVSLLGISCTSNDEESIDISKETLSVESSQRFESVIDSINNLSYPVIRRGKTRAVNENCPDSIILSSKDSIFLDQQERSIVKASKELLYSMNLSESEIYDIVGEDNDEAIAAAALLCMSLEHDNVLQTRSLTGNVYFDCALSALGLDLGSALRTACTKGVTKAVAKKFLVSALKASVGTSAGIVITMGLWGLCVGGIG